MTIKRWTQGEIEGEYGVVRGDFVDAADYDALVLRLDKALSFLDAHWSSCTTASTETIEALRNGAEIPHSHRDDCPFCRAMADSA